MWRPPPHIRAKAVAIARHEDRLLVVEVVDDAGIVSGWCPPGGGVDFGERAEDALRREVREELGCGVILNGPSTTFENIYEHAGAPGHEIVFAFPVTFDNPQIYAKRRFQIREDSGYVNDIEWVAVERFLTGSEVLFPAGLKEMLVSAV
jgi:8-oxo-dGTP pyrophosphatase MutT (NUDIX family)